MPQVHLSDHIEHRGGTETWQMYFYFQIKTAEDTQCNVIVQ